VVAEAPRMPSNDADDSAVPVRRATDSAGGHPVQRVVVLIVQAGGTYRSASNAKAPGRSSDQRICLPKTPCCNGWRYRRNRTDRTRSGGRSDLADGPAVFRRWLTLRPDGALSVHDAVWARPLCASSQAAELHHFAWIGPSRPGQTFIQRRYRAVS
jgi:hypothetical protein